MDNKHSARTQELFKKRKAKAKTNKLIDRLTFNPQKHKQKVARKLRENLQRKTLPTPAPPTEPITSLKFGSFNVNGLDLEALWSVEQLLSRGFDVISTNSLNSSLIKIPISGPGTVRNIPESRPAHCAVPYSQLHSMEHQQKWVRQGWRRSHSTLQGQSHCPPVQPQCAITSAVHHERAAVVTCEQQQGESCILACVHYMPVQQE